MPRKISGLVIVSLLLLSKPLLAVEKTCISGDCSRGYGVMEYQFDDKEIGVYSGNFVNNMRHGYGRYTTKYKKSLYVGDWKFDKKNGRGTFSDADGNKYVGQWKDNKRHGKGIYFFGVKEWKENSGHSEDWWKERTENYEGDFVDDKFHGKGTYRMVDGSKYIGNFEFNKKHGPGDFIYKTGSKIPQEWEYGRQIK